MKTQQHLELWQRIASFKIDDPNAEFPFSKKLAQENNWDTDFTLRVIAEYKKFVFLCATLPEGASPSTIVDEAWHLHLTYTKNYWEDFCPNVLGFSLHHHPSKGGINETQKHKDWYQKTLENYIAIFEEIPPTDIWSYPLNFNPAVYLPTDSPLLLPTIDDEPDDDSISTRFRFLKWTAYILFAITGLGVLEPALIHGSVFIQLFMALAAIVLILKWKENDLVKKNAESIAERFSSNLSPYFGAWVMGNEKRVALTTLHDVVPQCTFENDLIKFEKSQITVKRGNPLTTIFETLETPEVSINFVKTSTRTFGEFLENGLYKISLSDTSAHSFPIFLGFLLVGFARILEGYCLHKPIGFLILTVIITVLFHTILSANYKELDVWKHIFRDHYQPIIEGDVMLATSWQMALSGITIVSPLYWKSIDSAFQPPQRQGGDAGSASSCGGGGDGGGCGGGCGGCGGCGS